MCASRRSSPTRSPPRSSDCARPREALGMPRLSLDTLQTLASAALRHAGASDEMAQATARALVYAEARGLASHGVSRIAQYATHLANGRADGKAKAAVVAQRGG